MPQLIRVEVEQMLGHFDQVVEFPTDWEFVIIHGPNGVGKTKLLELISHTFKFQLNSIARLPFRTASFEFDDESTLRVTRVEAEKGGRPTKGRADRAEKSEREEHEYSIHFELKKPHANVITYTSTSPHRRIHPAELQSLPMIERIGRDDFQDVRTGAILNSAEVLELYGHLLPSELQASRERPKGLRDFLASINVYLIETQRLLSIPPASRPRYPSQPELPRSRVKIYSDDLTRRLKEALAQNSRRSQDLDRTFPGRLLKDAFVEQLTDEQIRDKYNRQAEFRARLAEIDVLGASSEYLPLPGRDLKDWERHVLWTYLDDTERKLETFKDVLGRLQLLQNIVNSRFRYKKLHISREDGFVITTDSGHRVTPDRLSSGEQHELVLVYGLLFEVQENTLVLIDEPEISLHVEWQQQFLTDLFEISQLTSLRFMIATHSPQIIHKWWERTVSLVPQGEADD